MGDFFNQVYAWVAKIPSGKVLTYGQIAAFIGSPRSARMVGWALRAAPDHLRLPCHRVVNRRGELAPEEAFGGAWRQRMLLEAEEVPFQANGCVDLRAAIWHPSQDDGPVC